MAVLFTLHRFIEVADALPQKDTSAWEELHAFAQTTKLDPIHEAHRAQKKTALQAKSS